MIPKPRLEIVLFLVAVIALGRTEQSFPDQHEIGDGFPGIGRKLK
jgi:hypothetical protein